MPDILLATLNAKFIHSAFGLRYLQANLGELQLRSAICEFDINQKPVDIAEAILAQNPRILGLGIYIWNVAPSTELVVILKRARPELIVVLGGPEVSYETEEQEIVRLADHVITGEADLAFADVCRRLLGPGEFRVQGSGFRVPKVIAAPLPDLAQVALPYEHYDKRDVAHRVLYVEASRGCPFSCEFCLSSLDIPVRAFPLEPFLGAMQRLLDRGARQFKFVDRTFNLNLATSRRILEFFLERWTPGLFIHFEMIPDRLPESLREVIARFPPGALQFEVGIQTFNPDVEQLISRRQDHERLEENLRWLRGHSGVHIHADLIAGLPGESLESFAAGFDRLLALAPQEIQVGLLKRLRGTPISRHDRDWAMVYNPRPPYEILATRLLDFAILARLRRFASFWDIFGNSGNFTASLPLLWQSSVEQVSNLLSSDPRTPSSLATPGDSPPPAASVEQVSNLFGSDPNARTLPALAAGRTGSRSLGLGPTNHPTSLQIRLETGSTPPVEQVSNLLSSDSNARTLPALAAGRTGSRSLGLGPTNHPTSLQNRLETGSTPPAEPRPLVFHPFEPQAPVAFHRRNLPHWEQSGATYFVTFRLADSIPRDLVRRWRAELAVWERKHPGPLSLEAEQEYRELFPRRWHEWLDAGMGSCRLREPTASGIVDETLRHFDGTRYVLGRFVIMPNHVHVLVCPLADWSLSRILHSWKRHSAREINRRFGLRGPFWQAESFDHLVRNGAHLQRFERYLEENPARARLKTGEFRLGMGTGGSNPPKIATGSEKTPELDGAIGTHASLLNRLETCSTDAAGEGETPDAARADPVQRSLRNRLETCSTKPSSFARFLAFADWLHARGVKTSGIALTRQFELLYEFLRTDAGVPAGTAATALADDYRRGGRRDRPSWLPPDCAKPATSPSSVASGGPSRQARHRATAARG